MRTLGRFISVIFFCSSGGWPAFFEVMVMVYFDCSVLVYNCGNVPLINFNLVYVSILLQISMSCQCIYLSPSAMATKWVV